MEYVVINEVLRCPGCMEFVNELVTVRPLAEGRATPGRAILKLCKDCAKDVVRILDAWDWRGAVTQAIEDRGAQ